jgi:hypothetical protein
VRAAQQQQLQALNSAEPGPADLVWRHTSPMEERDTPWVPHRIVRWNRQSVLVEAEPHLTGAQPRGQNATRRNLTYRLSRWELEQIGVARVHSRRIAFFTAPTENSNAIGAIESLMRLDLWFPFTEQELKDAYIQRALRAHPDAGGSNEKFRQLQHDRDRAEKLLSHPANAG